MHSWYREYLVTSSFIYFNYYFSPVSNNKNRREETRKKDICQVFDNIFSTDFYLYHETIVGYLCMEFFVVLTARIIYICGKLLVQHL